MYNCWYFQIQSQNFQSTLIRKCDKYKMRIINYLKICQHSMLLFLTLVPGVSVWPYLGQLELNTTNCVLTLDTSVCPCTNEVFLLYWNVSVALLKKMQTRLSPMLHDKEEFLLWQFRWGDIICCGVSEPCVVAWCSKTMNPQPWISPISGRDALLQKKIKQICKTPNPSWGIGWCKKKSFFNFFMGHPLNRSTSWENTWVKILCWLKKSQGVLLINIFFPKCEKFDLWDVMKNDGGVSLAWKHKDN